MSEPREPRFEDDFDDYDADPPDHWTELETTIEDIAIMKGHAYALENAPTDALYPHVKRGFQDGFLAGFAHRFATTDKVSE